MYTWEGSTSSSEKLNAKTHPEEEEDWKGDNNSVKDDKSETYSKPEDFKNVPYIKHNIRRSKSRDILPRQTNKKYYKPHKISNNEPQNIYFRQRPTYRKPPQSNENPDDENEQHRFLLNFLNIHHSELVRSVSEPYLNIDSKPFKIQNLPVRDSRKPFIASQHMNQIKNQSVKLNNQMVREQEKEVEICEIVPDYVLV